MIVTKQQLAVNLLGYLQNKITLTELVDWAENALMEGDIQGEEIELVRETLAKLGLADVKEFGLFWEDCSIIMKKLGYELRVDAGLVA